MHKHMRNHRLQSTKKNQRGIVSIVITIVLMLVLTLIVLAFAKASRREERNALERQLSTQAFYAAETGINDARTVLERWLANPTPANQANLNSDYMTSCTGFAVAAGAPVALDPATLTPGSAASYTCLFVDPSPSSIVYTKSDEQHVLPVRNKDGTAINTIEIYWDDDSGGNTFGGCPTPPNDNPTSFNVPPLTNNCDAPILRVEIVDAGNLTASKVVFVYPATSGAALINYGLATTGAVRQGNCSGGGPNRCRMVINGLGASEYYMRVKGIYGPAALTITANSGVAELVGAQALIDATGKAIDVERRIQVRVQANNLTGNIPLYGLEGTDKICKKFSIDGTTAIDNGFCWSAGTPD